MHVCVCPSDAAVALCNQKAVMKSEAHVNSEVIPPSLRSPLILFVTTATAWRGSVGSKKS